MTLSERLLPRSALLRLARAGCNAAEIAAAYQLSETDVERRLRHLAITVKRRAPGLARRDRVGLQVAA